MGVEWRWVSVRFYDRLTLCKKKLHANVRCRYSYTGIFRALAFFGKNLFLFVEVDHARKMNLFTRTALYPGMNPSNSSCTFIFFSSL